MMSNNGYWFTSSTVTLRGRDYSQEEIKYFRLSGDVAW